MDREECWYYMYYTRNLLVLNAHSNGRLALTPNKEEDDIRNASTTADGSHTNYSLGRCDAYIY